MIVSLLTFFLMYVFLVCRLALFAASCKRKAEPHKYLRGSALRLHKAAVSVDLLFVYIFPSIRPPTVESPRPIRGLDCSEMTHQW